MTTKDGKFRGSQDFEYLVDLSIRIEKGSAEVEKVSFCLCLKRFFYNISTLLALICL